MDYEERLRREVMRDIKRFNRTGRLPKETDVIFIKPKEKTKKEKIEWKKQD